jgi:hypothetical protein
MASPNLPYYISLAICAISLAVVIATYATLLPKDSAQNTKLLATIGVFAFAVSFVGYGLALFHFSQNPVYMIQFILAMLMLVVLPASLMAVSVSTVTISNLRDTVATA